MGEIFDRPFAEQEMPFTGERLTPSLTGETPIEHWHRYLLARELARGRDVLDIASGEGYGSALVAQTASSVTGVDASEEAVKHANTSYASKNVRFLHGDARQIPLRNESIDLVISFETLEHFAEHHDFMREVKRVLRPGGALLISTPERDNYSPANALPNPFHVNELTEQEFTALLGEHFGHVFWQGQRVLLGSAIVGEGRQSERFFCFERRGPVHFEVSRGVARMRYVVALASDDEHWSLPPSVYIETSNIGYTDAARLEHIDQEVGAAAARYDEVVQENASLRDSVGSLEERCTHAEQISQTAQKQATEAESARDAANERANKAEAETQRLQTEIAGVSERADHAEFEAQRLRAEIASVSDRADRAESEAQRLRTEMANLSNRAEQAESESLRRRSEIVPLMRRIESLEASCERAERICQVIRTQAAAAELGYDEANKRADQLEAEAQELRIEAKRAQSEVAALRASTSWRITGPFRRLIRLLRAS